MGKPKNTADASSVAHEMAAQIARVLAMPLHMLAEAYNRSIPSQIQAMTGLSKARISKGRFDKLRPSTLRKIEIGVDEWMRSQIGVDAESLTYLENLRSSAPSQCGRPNSVWEDWVHQFEVASEWRLLRTRQIARVIDDLAASLLGACQQGQLDSVKTLMMEHLAEHGEAIRSSAEEKFGSASVARVAQVSTTDDWPTASAWLREVLDCLYFDLLAALDVEWSTQYLSERNSQPIFPMVMACVREDIFTASPSSSRRNVVTRPPRRLLEFLYAVVYRKYRARWPDGPPTPATLAGSLDLSPSEVSDYFDGTRKLTIKTAQDHWASLLRHFQRGKKEPWLAPLPVMLLALHWQELLVLDQGRSVMVPDMNAYLRTWHIRRAAWTGPPSTDALSWPTWLLRQPSVPC